MRRPLDVRCRAIPFVLLTGDLMNRSGMAERLMHFANLIIGRGWVRPCQRAGLASVFWPCGVAEGDIAAFRKLEVTETESTAMAAPVAVASQLMGPIIPPIGIMPPTKAAAALVVHALLVGVLINRALTLKDLYRIIVSTSCESARLLFMIGGALTMTWIFALENDLENDSGIARNVLVGLALIRFAPVVAPIAHASGVSEPQLGMMFIMNVTIGNMPFAMCSTVSLNTGALIRELIPFLAIKFALLIVVGAVPALTSIVPAWFGSN